MADVDVPLWHAFFDRIRRDMYEYHMVDLAGEIEAMTPQVPLDYYTLLYGYDPTMFILAFDDRVHAGLQAASPLTRLRTLHLVRRFNKQTSWLMYTATGEADSRYTAKYAPGVVMSENKRYKQTLEEFGSRVSRLLLVQESPDKQAVYASESPFLPWFYDSMFEQTSDATEENVYDTTGLLHQAQTGYPRMLRLYKQLMA